MLTFENGFQGSVAAGGGNMPSSNATENDVVFGGIKTLDRLINICEIKYTSSEYEITSDDDIKYRNRVAAFLRQSKTKIGTLPTWITPFGLLPNKYSANIQYQVTMDDLFAE